MVRLSNTEYMRPEKTYQENLSTEQIREKLQDYTKVDKISDVPLNTQLRYFVIRKNPQTNATERLFRLGGRLLNKNNADKYVVLTNGSHTWSVNTETSTFFRPLTVAEVHDRYEKQVTMLKKKVSQLEKQLGGGGGGENSRG